MNPENTQFTVLALDAAWTNKQPTGLAVLVGNNENWRCAALAPSYESFLTLAAHQAIDWNGSFRGSEPNIAALLAAATKLADSQSVDLVTIDMPVATCLIEGRREADNAVSKRFGGMNCSTHTPNSVRPGTLGGKLTREFQRHSFRVATTEVLAGTRRCLVEVYPHPALLRLLNVDNRVTYKVAKSRSYWPEQTGAARITLLLERFECILSALNRAIQNIPLQLPKPEDVRCLVHLKKYENALDALISGWVAMQYLSGNAEPFGDSTAAIWVPKAGQND